MNAFEARAGQYDVGYDNSKVDEVVIEASGVATPTASGEMWPQGDATEVVLAAFGATETNFVTTIIGTTTTGTPTPETTPTPTPTPTSTTTTPTTTTPEITATKPIFTAGCRTNEDCSNGEYCYIPGVSHDQAVNGAREETGFGECRDPQKDVTQVRNILVSNEPVSWYTAQRMCDALGLEMLPGGQSIPDAYKTSNGTQECLFPAYLWTATDYDDKGGVYAPCGSASCGSCYKSHDSGEMATHAACMLTPEMIPSTTPVPTPSTTPVPMPSTTTTPTTTPTPTPSTTPETTPTPMPSTTTTPTTTPVPTPTPTPETTPTPMPSTTPVPTPSTTPVPTPSTTPVPMPSTTTTPTTTPVPTPTPTPETTPTPMPSTTTTPDVSTGTSGITPITSPTTYVTSSSDTTLTTETSGYNTTSVGPDETTTGLVVTTSSQDEGTGTSTNVAAVMTSSQDEETATSTNVAAVTTSPKGTDDGLNVTTSPIGVTTITTITSLGVQDDWMCKFYEGRPDDDVPPDEEQMERVLAAMDQYCAGGDKTYFSFVAAKTGECPTGWKKLDSVNYQDVPQPTLCSGHQASGGGAEERVMWVKTKDAYAMSEAFNQNEPYKSLLESEDQCKSAECHQEVRCELDTDKAVISSDMLDCFGGYMENKNTGQQKYAGKGDNGKSCPVHFKQAKPYYSVVCFKPCPIACCEVTIP